jgi:hypothetical protein
MIEIGDIVCVNFNNVQYTLCSRAIVKYVPLSPGDSWVFENESTGEIHYVSEGCTVTKLNDSSFFSYTDEETDKIMADAEECGYY